MLTFLILLQKFYIAPFQDCLLRSAPSAASVKHNGLDGREEGDGAINRYLAESNRKPIPGLRASNRKGTAQPGGTPRVGNNKFHLRCRAETAVALDLRGRATQVCLYNFPEALVQRFPNCGP